MELAKVNIGVRFSHIEQSYKIMQQTLSAFFPADAEAAYEETLDLYEDELQFRHERRQAILDSAEQFKLLFIDGLREKRGDSEQLEWRKRMLYRLASLFELAAVVDPTAVESLASKINVSYEQGIASAVLKALAIAASTKKFLIPVLLICGSIGLYMSSLQVNIQFFIVFLSFSLALITSGIIILIANIRFRRA